MAYARIISGGPTGRYTVELDYGESLRLAALAATTARLSQLDTQIAQLEVTLAEAEALEEARREKIRVLAAEIIGAASQLNNGTPGVNTLPTLPIVQEQRKLGELIAFHQPIRDQLAALKIERANWRRKAAQWNTLQTKVQKQAWCVDYTDDIPANAYTATCDIPGDPNLVLIAAGGRAWQASDGEFRARELLSPAQCYFNAAIFPGWQKFKPTYRWGTLTTINYTANTCTVSLFAQTSSAQRLSVNQAATLTNVPVVYMTCNARAFTIGDRVVVQFLGQNWSSPRVIGFVDNPKPCRGLYSQISVPGQSATVQNLFTGQDINGFVAPAAPYVYHPLPPGSLNAFIGWHIQWDVSGSPPLREYSLSRSLPTVTWTYAARPYTSRTASAQYFDAFPLNALSIQTLVERIIREELIPGSDPPAYNRFVSGRYGVTVNIYRGTPGSTTNLEFTFYFERVGDEVGVGEFGDPYAVTPPYIVFSPSGEYPDLSKTFSGNTSTFSMPYSVTITWTPATDITWTPVSILPLEPPA